MSILPIGINRPPELSQRLEAAAATQAAAFTAPTVERPPPSDDPHLTTADVARTGHSSGTARRPRTAEQQKALLADKNAYRQKAHQGFKVGGLARLSRAFGDDSWNRAFSRTADELLAAARDPEGDVGGMAGDQAPDDPFKRYLLLLSAQQRTEPGEPAAQRLGDALDHLWLEHEERVVAGFNTMDPLLDFARGDEEWNWLRNLYVDCLIPGDLARTFRGVLQRVAAGRIRPAMSAIRKALVADLASPLVCADKERWQQEHLDLVDNQRISALIGDAYDFYRRVHACEPEATKVMGFVDGELDLASEPTARKLQSLCALVVPPEKVTEGLRNQVKNHLKAHLPLWLWSSPAARDQLLFPAVLRARL